MPDIEKERPTKPTGWLVVPVEPAEGAVDSRKVLLLLGFAGIATVVGVSLVFLLTG